MNKLITSTAVPPRELKLEAIANISASFELLCLASGMEALGEMMEHDAQAICGPRHARGPFRRAHRWGKAKGKIGFHGGNIEIERPRLRSFEGKEQALPSWEASVAEDWLGKWAMNQMLINVATRKFARSVRLPAGDVPAPVGAGLSKSAASRRFVALSAARLKEWMASDLSGLDLLVIQIDGIHMDDDLILVAALGRHVRIPPRLPGHRRDAFAFRPPEDPRNLASKQRVLRHALSPSCNTGGVPVVGAVLR